MNIFDIFIAYISWGSEGKKRPVLILEQQPMVINVFNITTQYENKSEAIRSKYFKINDWQKAGLDKQSYIDTNVVRDLPPSALDGKTAIGKLTEYDVQKFLEFLTKQDG
ncbi:MAG: type II toxin-antitoxin system PemK/MazF family toxin [Treponema sp.]|nr:type II toxin-antitoxin system PemK/MazF family toxin [Treponema sp.]